MTNEEFSNLKPGDIIQGLSSGLAYTVDSSNGRNVTVTRVMIATNPSEWNLVQKATPTESLDLNSLTELQVPGNAESQPPEPPSPESLMEDEDAIEAVEQCDRILSGCDEIPERGEDFATSIIEKVESMRETIVSRDHVTERQLIALQNMEDGVDRWIN